MPLSCFSQGQSGQEPFLSLSSYVGDALRPLQDSLVTPA